MAAAGVGAVFSRLAAFRAGFASRALNPKIALFHGSVFATALPARPSGPLVLLLAVLLVFGHSVTWHTGRALLLSRPGIQRADLRHSWWPDARSRSK